MMVQIEGLRNASTASSRKKRGKTSIRSTRRITRLSTMPPWYPAAAPSSTPIAAAIPTETKPTASEIRDP